MNKRFLAAGASVAAAAMVLTACTPPGGGDDEKSSEKSSVNIGWNESFRSMNTQSANGNAVSNAILTYMMNDNFGYYDDELEVQDGALGKLEKVSDDPLKVKYTFNDDAKWSDGTPVDAADLALTWAGYLVELQHSRSEQQRRRFGQGERCEDRVLRLGLDRSEAREGLP